MRITKSGVSEYVALAPNVILPSTEPPLDVPPPNEHALLEIPIDIVRLILECVVESDGIVSAGKKGGRSQRVLNGSAPVLAACCLLSRSFYLIAREMLYASIVVPGPLVQEDVVSQLWLDDAGAVTPRKLVESLADNPHLAHLVRHITIEFKQEQLSPPRLASQLITRLLDLCSGADSFRLSSPGDAWAACASALTSRRSRLRRLELRGVTEAPENGRITRILQLSPGLQVLTLENISWMALPSATNNPPSLSHLTIALHLTEPHTLPSILQNSKDSLRSLDLHVSSHHFLSILTTFTSLRHLTLTIFDLALDHRIRPQDTDSTLVDSIISTFPQLTIKKLSLVVGPSSRSGDTVAVLSSLPPTLQSLHITHVEPHILLDFLGSDRSPNLRDIELRRGQGPILTYQAWVSSCLTEPGFLEACAGRGMVVHGGDHSASPVFSVERAAFETLEQYLQPALDLRYALLLLSSTSADNPATLFRRSRRQRNTDIPWIDFRRAMHALGFSSRKSSGGSAWKFMPPPEIGDTSRAFVPSKFSADETDLSHSCQSPFMNRIQIRLNAQIRSPGPAYVSRNTMDFKWK